MKPSGSFASDNDAGVHPEVLEAIRRANQGHVVGYGDDPYTESAMGKFQEQFGADVAVSYLYRRMWGAGEVYGLQTGASGSAGREAYGGNGGPCISRNRRPASCAAAGDFDYAIDRDGDSVQAGRSRGAGAVRARAENVLAHGWGADFKRGGGAATDSSAGDARFGRRCAVVWRDEKRVDGRGGGGVLSSGTGGGFFVCAQAGDATGVENALPVGANGGAADGRPLAAECGAREPDGATAGTGSEEDSASQDCVSSGGKRGVCANSAGSDSEDTGALLLLCVERRGVGGALDVFIRHNGGGRPRVCGVCGGNDGGPGELKAPRCVSVETLAAVRRRGKPRLYKRKVGVLISWLP